MLQALHFMMIYADMLCVLVGALHHAFGRAVANMTTCRHRANHWCLTHLHVISRGIAI